MKPLNSNLHLKPEEGCTKISSSCVVWQGPDIPCIDLCKGDTITDVVYKLAMMLCEMTDGVIDISTLDFKCLVEEGIAEPTTLIETLQAIIDKQCFFEENCCSDGSGGSVTNPISLPPCLYYTEDGDEITSLMPAAYSQYLAEKICNILTSIASINLSIASLNNRVTVLENAPGGGTGGGNISVVSQCASSSSPGIVVPIAQAFSAFEGKFCQLTTLLGTSAAISTAIGTECAGLDNQPQLLDSEQIMSEIPGWVSTPTTLSQTIVNMWLTICDMRAAIQSVLTPGVPGCIPVPVSNIQITNLSASGSTITWTAPSVGTNENPSQYNLKVYEWNGSATVGSPVINVNKTFPITSHVVSGLADPSKTYQIQITAEYSCESSVVATAVGKLALTSVSYCVSATDVAHDEVTQVCQGETYTVKRRKTTLTLRDIATNNVIPNGFAPFTAQINYDVTGDCSLIPTETITKTFATGVSTVEHIYENERYVQCGADPCTVKVKIYNCLGTVSGDKAVVCTGEETC
jgi:hypothetical protein